jgi:DNA repair protein RadC
MLPDVAGHRARLRRRLIEQGADTLLDHEIVEYLLALAIPHRDPKPLLHEFGGIDPLLSTEPEALMSATGMGEAAVEAIRITHASALRLPRASVEAQPVLSGWQALLDYLEADMAHVGIEPARVLHLNRAKLRFRRAHNPILYGSAQHADARDDLRGVDRPCGRASPRDYPPLDRIGSASMILFHNHSTDCPSRQDIAHTCQNHVCRELAGRDGARPCLSSAKGRASLRALG